MKRRKFNSLYEKLHYDGKSFTTKTITRDEMDSIDRTSVDFFWSIDLDILTYKTSDGKFVEQSISETKLGTRGIRILELVQCEPGSFFTPAEIAELLCTETLRENNNVSAIWRRIREALSEDFENPNFCLSKRPGGFGIAWPASKSFIQIIRIPNHN